MTVEVKVDDREFAQADMLLKQLDKSLRVEGTKDALKAGGEVVVARAKQEVPQPGYPGDDPRKKPLKETITSVVREYHSSGTFVSIVGPAHPAGAHGHLVHEGHDIWLPNPPFTEGADTYNTGRRTDPDPFLERAADATVGQQTQAIVGALQRVAARQ